MQVMNVDFFLEGLVAISENKEKEYVSMKAESRERKRVR